jgi:glycosyltransferase involved in cell wall biosynthesis
MTGPALSVIIPALNEEAAVAQVVMQALRQPQVCEVIVVDNGSTDRTGEVAAAAGARVVREARRGYGYACLAGAQAAKGQALVFLDADGSFDAVEIPILAEPILLDQADLVLGSRELGSGKDAILPHQRFGNWLTVALIRWLFGLRVTDLGPFRAIPRDQLERLAMSEMTFGWPIEMMVKAARIGYRIVEVPVSYHPRVAGKSKVSGTIRGSLMAGYCILSTTLRHARLGRAAGAKETTDVEP